MSTTSAQDVASPPAPRTSRAGSGWRWVRRGAQLAGLVLFFWLFRRTESTGADTLPGGENLFFRLDPLSGAAALASGRQILHVLALFWPAGLVLLFTFIFGRFFCGWFCPVGTLLDWFHRLTSPLSRRTNRLAARGVPVLPKARSLRYAILALVLLGALVGFPLIGLFDPFALLTRGLAFWVDPAYYNATDAAFTFAGAHHDVAAPKRFFTDHLLPFRANIFQLAGLSASLLGALFLLEFLARRFWCRYLCPAGALLGLVARFALLRRQPVKVCKTCGQCAGACRMGALDAEKGLSPEACNLCLDCVDACPKGIAKFRGRRVKPAPAPPDLSRRGALIAAATGIALPLIGVGARAATGRTPGAPGPYLLRPPGAGGEKRFLSLCVRCGLCLKACPTNVLQPAGLEAGVEGLFSPRLIPRLIFEQSYCEYNCNLCGQVCPTGAIPCLPLDRKHATPTGKAYFDHARCLPWAKQTSCIRCEEMCPLPEKAIHVQNTFTVKDEKGEEIEIQQPCVDREACIGCGICESNCPIEGAAGIRVRRPDAPDPGTEFRAKEPPTTTAAAAVG